jgi:dipeptidyl aminopeptidase/acylaminoacyl peptidase
VVYARTVPRPTRPWFATELREVDLISGEDRRLATFTAGWESRPRALSAAPRGRWIAFIGPPFEVGADETEHSMFQTAVYLADLGDAASGPDSDGARIVKISGESPYAFDAECGRQLAWSADEQTLLVPIIDGSRTGLARLRRTGPDDGWTVERIPELGGEIVSHVAVSGDRERAVYVAQGRVALPRLGMIELGTDTISVLDAPNAELADRWTLSEPEDASFDGPGGERIDAWWYRPVVRVDDGPLPLIVAYYGGAMPTNRRLNMTHQRLAGNGYAVLVINPRGAIGYGQAFADAHVNDWGPLASADILAGVDALLAAHPDELDSQRIGIYGGSYGGFMTSYLASISDRFAAAVSLYGISDLASYWGSGGWGYTYSDVASAGSFPWNAADLYAGHSPLYRADRIRTPMLLLHGDADANVPPSESEQLYTALSVLGTPVELVLFPGEDHGIWSARQHRDAHREMIVEWFDRFLRDQPGAWDARWKR